MNDLSLYIVLGLSAIVIAETVYLGLTELDRRKWRMFVNAVGGEAEAFRLITGLNILNDRTDMRVQKGFTAFTTSELDELLAPRYGPVQPKDFQVVDRISHAPLRQSLPEEGDVA